jgi:hypothetical protein
VFLIAYFTLLEFPLPQNMQSSIVWNMAPHSSDVSKESIASIFRVEE